MKTLTENQIKLLKMYAKKAKVDSKFVIDAVKNEVITVSEVSQGILGEKVL